MTAVNRLEPIIARTRSEVARRRRERPLEVLEQEAAQRIACGDARSFEQALAQPGLSLIAEHKRRSPSAGVIRQDLDLEDVVIAYERGGARALSILTEPESFGGSLEDLRKARATAGLPLLRKDFVLEPYQLVESAAAGADAVLLIVAALEVDALRDLGERADALGLATLVEVHDERELEVAADVGARLIGINNRDLTTLRVDVGRTFGLVPLVAPGVIVVAESGFSRRSELDELERAGVDAVLVGEALMRCDGIEAACRALTGA